MAFRIWTVSRKNTGENQTVKGQKGRIFRELGKSLPVLPWTAPSMPREYNYSLRTSLATRSDEMQLYLKSPPRKLGHSAKIT